MADTTLKKHCDDRGVTTLTLDRPDKANAIDQQLLDQLFNSLQEAASSRYVRLVVLRGTGKHFCGGADIGDLHNHTAPITLPGLCEILDAFPKPTICVVQGACIGAGVALAACCDTAIATHHARFSIPEVRLGVAPAPLIPAMARACGTRFLRRYLLGGEQFGALEAHRVGLVHELCETADLENVIASSVDGYLRAAPGAIKAAKALLRQFSGTSSFPVRHELEEIFNTLAGSDEAKEGITSFKEARSPDWYRTSSRLEARKPSEPT